ncbi:MAG: hypothetical protein M3O15_14530 [Acidobacteriota bacterium]|nr:hypothetical protein [Acidobacteriota bacterium]
MKKLDRRKRLSLGKETLADLQHVSTGAESGLTLTMNDTVYQPAPSDNCSVGCPKPA